jgi:serine protease Do
MFRKISLILIIATVCAVGYAQQTEKLPTKLQQPKTFSEKIGDILRTFSNVRITTQYSDGRSYSDGESYMEQLEEMARLNQLNNSEGYLGVETVEVTKQNIAKYGLSTVRGVAVEKVVENSPAQQAGVKIGDVIIAIDGEEVSSIRKLIRIISEISADHQAKLTILRNGEEREITVTLSKRPPEKFDGGTFRIGVPMPIGEGRIMQMPIPDLPSSDGEILVRSNGGNTVVFYNEDRQIGARVTPLSKQLADYFGVSEGKGMLITEIIEDSPAVKAGLKAGDVIVELDGKQITNQLELTRSLMAKKEGEVSLTIVRDKNRQTIKVLPSIVKRNGRIIKDEITTRY